jgi:hypothetical protein
MSSQSTGNPPSNAFKRLIVCCDGTWVAGDHVTKHDSSYQTNITRICHALADDAILPDGTRIPQIIYYQSGVASSGPTIGRVFAGELSIFYFLFSLVSFTHTTLYHQVPLATASTKTFSPPTTSSSSTIPLVMSYSYLASPVAASPAAVSPV